MKQRIITVLMALCLLTSMLCGCGGTSSASSLSAQVSAPESLSDSPDAEAPPSTEESPEASEDEIAAAEASEAETAGEPEEGGPLYEPVEYELPLTEEEVTYSIYANFPPYLSGFLDTFADQVAYQAWQERTGIRLEFYESSDRTAMATQIALMAASGDFYDLLFNLNMFYSGGVVKAIDDEIILDLADLAAEYAPNYMCVVTSDEAHEKAVYDDEGHMGAIYGFVDVSAPQNGAIIRKDWLDNLGLEEPKTLGDWHDVLTAFKNSYDITDPFFLTSAGQNQTNLCGCFGTAGLVGMYHDGETVKCGLLDDSFKDYLMMIQDWYNEGLVNHDFYSRSAEIRDSGLEQAVLNGQCGIYYSPANTIVDYVLQNADPNAVLVGLAEPTADDGTPNTFGNYPSYLGDNCISISTTAPQPELIVQCIDYLFSEEGQILCNWGIEGQSFEYGPDGKPQYTELITNNQEGIPVEQWCRVKYTLIDMPSLFVLERTWGSYTDEQMDTILNKWSYPYDSTLPTLSLTTEETERFYGLYLDIDTYVDETVIKYIIGDYSFDDWNVFTDTVEQMGIQECIDIYQQAYTRYLAR